MHIRLLILLLLVTTVCHAQSVLKTPVALTRTEGTAGELLEDLNKIPKVVISYSSAVIDLERKVALSGEEKLVEDVLKVICREQPVKYIEQNGKVFLISTQSKKKYTLSGYISDKQSGERLIGASVYLPGLQTGTTSNIYGFYSITLEEVALPLQVSYAGYHTWAAELTLQQDQLLNIALEKNIVINEMVIVSASARSPIPERTLTGKTDINSAFVESVPALLAEQDVLKAVQMLPGVQAGNEGTSGLNVRGGSADQNLILLDGVPVYNASHAFGVFSIFNADAVNNVEVLKSGFPSSYGGRLSSVVDVHIKEGDKYDFHGDGGIGIIFSRLTFEGPIEKGKSSFLVSARRTYADALAAPIMSWTNSLTRIYPHFGDLNLKANFPTGKKDRIYFSLYAGQDKLMVKDKYASKYNTIDRESKEHNGFAWGNTTAMVRWNHVFNKKLFSNFTFTHSRYQFHVTNMQEEMDHYNDRYFKSNSRYVSFIRDWNLKADFDYLPRPDHFVKAGFSATAHRYSPGVFDINDYYNGDADDQHIEQAKISTGEFDAYIEDDIRLSSKMKTNIGARFSAFSVRGRLFTSLQPRVNWLYNLNKGWNIKASYGKMNQFLHLLSNSGVGLPTDLWLPVTPRVPPQYSHQASAGASWAPNRAFMMSMELYYKTLNNVIDFNEESVFFDAYANWEDLVAIGKGKAYGVEWLAQKKTGKFTGIVSYTLSRATRQFNEINKGKSFPFKYDRRHEFKTAVTWERSKRFEVSAAWFYASGLAISLPESTYLDPVVGIWVNVYESRNGYRMPDYHRLDLSVKFKKQKKRYLRTWVISVYNAYNRFNPFYLEEATSADPNTQREFDGIAVFPIIPSISYQFKF